VIRFAAVALLLAGAGQVRAQHQSIDPLFQTLPFQEWIAGGEQTQFKWTLKIAPPHLSNHQRLITEVEARMDGVELAKRRGKGELLVMVQFTDADGRVYQGHESIDLEKVEEGVKKSDVVYSQPVFLRPGEYHVAVALFVTATKEHSVRKETLRVAPLKNDPLPEAWNSLPPVEFIGVKETPDSWYLPDVRRKLNLPVAAERPVRIEVIVNLTPSERATGSFRVQDRNLSTLLPALKALTQMHGAKVTLNVSLLDLSRRKVTFRQEDVHELDWTRMRDALAETTPGSIDVKSLEDRQHNASFFVAEVARRIAGEDAPVVIVLSSPVEFEAGQDLRPIGATAKGRVIYIRYHPQRRPVTSNGQLPPMMGRPRMGGGMPISPRTQPLAVDQLEPTLKPLNPELFDPLTADEFRKVLADLIREAAHW
jgi:hypothetical protein